MRIPIRKTKRDRRPEHRGPLRARWRTIRNHLKGGWRNFGRWLRRPALYRSGTAERIGSIYTVPCEMSIPERLFLYALIRGWMPERVLEIGTSHGGSAAIMANALEDNGQGRIFSIDPDPKVRVPRRAFHDRFTQVVQYSPEGIGEAREAAGGPFDLVLIDGLHIHDQVVKDVEGCLPHLAEQAYMVFHDAFHCGVGGAISEMVEKHAQLHDCGYPCAAPITDQSLMAYGGFRFLRVSATQAVDPLPLIEKGYRAAGKEAPQANPDLYNHDIWYCQVIEPCPMCRKQKTEA